jgi:hypothetical protein
VKQACSGRFSNLNLANTANKKCFKSWFYGACLK